MDEQVTAIIESILGPLREAAGRSWIEPERVRLTLRAKARPRRFADDPPSVTATIEADLPGADLRVDVSDGRARVQTRAR